MPQLFPECLTVPTNHVRSLRELLVADGHPIPFSLESRSTAADECTVPLMQDARLLQWAEDCGRGPAMGYGVGLSSQPEDHGVLGFALMSCSTLGDALTMWARFAPTLAGGFDACRVIVADRLELHFRDPFPSLPGRQAGLDRFIAFTVKLCLQLGHIPAKMLELRLVSPLLERARSAPPGLHLPALRLSPAGARLVLPLHCLDVPIASHQPSLLPLLLEKCEREAALARRPGDWIARVERLLEHRLEAPLSIEQAARELCVSTRTLKRRLNECNRTYRSIVDGLRKRAALRALEDPTLRIEDIAYQLGYTDQANFARAFRRWTCDAPGRYRCRTHSDHTIPSPAFPLATDIGGADGRQTIRTLQAAKSIAEVRCGESFTRRRGAPFSLD